MCQPVPSTKKHKDFLLEAFIGKFEKEYKIAQIKATELLTTEFQKCVMLVFSKIEFNTQNKEHRLILESVRNHLTPYL